MRFAILAFLCLGLASCGGSGSPLPSGFSVVSVTFVTPSDAPLDPTLTALPKNSWIRIEFTKAVDPATVNAQTIRVRQGPGFATEAAGFFEVDGAVVRFDSTRLANGGPHPFGFAALAGFRIQLRSIQEAAGVVYSRDGDPLAIGLTQNFATSDRYIVEGVPPRAVGARFLPEADPTTGLVPADAILFIDFDETILPETVRLTRHVIEAHTTVDVRYTDTPTNAAAGLAGVTVPGATRLSPDARSIEFRPFFSFGHQPFAFEVTVLAGGVRDLAGNAVASAQTLGPFTCDGAGEAPGILLFEDFFLTADRDTEATEVDWGGAQVGVCIPPPITTRDVFVLGSSFADQGQFSSVGTYYGFASPLVGATLVNANPPSTEGRRVMLWFSDDEMGPAGSIIGLAWGPARNRTRAATYPSIQIYASFAGKPTQGMLPTFPENAPTPELLYRGNYEVVQSNDVGNTPGLPLVPHRPGYASGNQAPCNSAANHNQPLFDFTGFEPWPTLQNTFDWDPGSPASFDAALVLDFHVPEGTDIQVMRSLYGHITPCQFLLQPTAFSNRRLRGVVGNDAPKPAPPDAINPEPTVMDTRITLSNFRTHAQSLFYTPPGDPSVATGGVTFGTDSDYGPAAVTDERPGATRTEIEYQGATVVDADRQTIDVSQPFTPWTRDVDDCDGMPYIRWRLRFVGDYNLNVVPTAFSVQLPIRDASAGP